MGTQMFSEFHFLASCVRLNDKKDDQTLPPTVLHKCYTKVYLMITGRCDLMFAKTNKSNNWND